jgi:hypothetical protein
MPGKRSHGIDQERLGQWFRGRDGLMWDKVKDGAITTIAVILSLIIMGISLLSITGGFGLL